MLKSGGAVTLMKTESEGILFDIGSKNTLSDMPNLKVKEPYNDEIIEFLNTFSKELFGDNEAKRYPDVITLAFWCRKAEIQR